MGIPEAGFINILVSPQGICSMHWLYIRLVSPFLYSISRIIPIESIHLHDVKRTHPLPFVPENAFPGYLLTLHIVTVSEHYPYMTGHDCIHIPVLRNSHSVNISQYIVDNMGMCALAYDARFGETQEIEVR